MAGPLHFHPGPLQQRIRELEGQVKHLQGLVAQQQANHDAMLKRNQKQIDGLLEQITLRNEQIRALQGSPT